jgi:hypothetical protein
MGSSITIDNLDGLTVAALQAEAQRKGVALSVVARDALRRGLSSDATTTPKPESDALRRLLGTWTQADADEFEAATAPFREIDPEMWK